MVARYTENQVQLDRPTRGGLVAPDTGAAAQEIARGVASLGQSISKAADDLNDIQAVRDEAAVRKLDAEDAVTFSKLRATALSSTGFDAEAATQSALEQMQGIRKARQQELKSPRQRAMYDDIFNRRMATTQEDFGKHTIVQTVKANQEAAGARADAYTDVAINEYNNPQAYQDAVDTVDREVETVYKGAGPDVIQRRKAMARSNIHKGIIGNLLSNPETVLDAEQWRRDHSAEILPEDETALQKQLNPLLEEEQDNALLGMVLSGRVDDAIAGVDDDAPTASAVDPLAPLPDGEAPAQAAPRRTRAQVFSQDPVKAVLRGKASRVSTTAAGHRARGSGNALDIAAPEGTPIYPPMSGEVQRVWYDQKGGWSMLVKHPNGYVTGYAHMRGEPPLKAGEKVDSDTVIGSVGSTGRSTGPHLHYTVRQSSGGPKVDPAAVRWSDASDITTAPGTVSPTKPNWKEGDLPRYEAKEPNMAKALEDAHRLATARNLSPRQYDRLVANVRQHYAVNASLYRESQDRVLDAAAAALAAAELDGKPMTERSQVPGYGQLDAGGRARVDGILASNRKALLGDGDGEGGGKVKANGPDFLDLLEASATDPEGFKDVELRLVSTITPGERARLLGIQSKIHGTEFATQHGRIYTMIDRFANMNMAGYVTQKPTDQDRQRRAQLFEAVNGIVAARQQKLKRQLTDDEISGIVRSQVVSITRISSGRDARLPRYVADRTPKKAGERDVLSIPKADRDRIVASWQRRNGGAMPTSEQISAIYLRSIGH